MGLAVSGTLFLLLIFYMSTPPPNFNKHGLFKEITAMRYFPALNKLAGASALKTQRFNQIVWGLHHTCIPHEAIHH
jgi:hypothetical protein